MVKQMKVVKRNGLIEDFDINKIIKAVEAAYNSQGYKLNNSSVLAEIEFVFTRSYICDNLNVENIQDEVEKILFDLAPYKVARAYVLYREQHKKIRNFASNKIKFINKYVNSDNTANATIDDNSNVSNQNIAVLNSEIHKEENQQINFKILENKLRELYPEFNYKQLNEDLNTIAYLHDSSSQIGMPYCVAITMYPFLLNGIKDIGGLSASPKNIDSFC